MYMILNIKAGRDPSLLELTDCLKRQTEAGVFSPMWSALGSAEGVSTDPESRRAPQKNDSLG